MSTTPPLGIGIGWRPELALAIERYPRLGFVELLVENVEPEGALPAAVENLRRRGVPVLPHGVTLNLGGAEPLDPLRVDRLGRLATRLGAPLVSEHLAFVRAGSRETGHLLPLPRTRQMLGLMVEQVRLAKDRLPVPLAVENIACLFEWPHAEMDEATFLAELLEQADVGLLLDLENVYANCRNHGGDPGRFLDRLPLSRLAYVHVAGGIERQGLYHDTHAHPVPKPVLDLLEELCGRTEVPGVMLERDDSFPSDAELTAELDALAEAVARGNRRREAGHVRC